MAKVNLHTAQGEGGTVTLAAGAEAIVAEVTSIATTPENATVQLDGNIPTTTVAEDTEVVYRIRRSSVTGTVVATMTTKPGASAVLSAGIQATDSPGDTSGLIYVLTMEGVAKKASKSIKATLQATW